MKCAPLLGVILLQVQGIALAQDWEIERVAEGTKPELALDAAGRPHIAYLIERPEGHVLYAVKRAGEWEIERVSQGYFYGPLDLVLDEKGGPHIAYHDHQKTPFSIDAGDAVYAFKEGGEWTLETIESPGHDGWDPSIDLGPRGEVHIASIDPVEFGRRIGLEWALRLNGKWSVEAIGSGPLPYEFGTDIVVDEQGRPHIVYHEDRSDPSSIGQTQFNPGTKERFDPEGEGRDLVYAVLGKEGWKLEKVDTEGDVGKFASLALDRQGRPHIAYFEWLERNAGYLKYAFWDGEAWQRERVGYLPDIEISFFGARRTMSLALDHLDRPHIAYSHKRTLKYVHKEEGEWESQTVAGVSLPGMALGQFASLELDAEDRPHIAYYELPDVPTSTLGTIFYAVRASPTAVGARAQAPLPEAFQLGRNFPNPFNAGTTIRYLLPRRLEVELAIYDLKGQRIRVLVRQVQDGGRHRVGWDGRDGAGRPAATGVYFSRLRAGEFTATRKMLLVR